MASTDLANHSVAITPGERELSPGPKRLRLRRSPRRRGLAAFLFVLPMVLAFVYFSWFPIIRSLFLSFQQTNLVEYQWVGFDNFRTLFEDPLVWTATRNTLYFAALALVIGFPTPLFLAVVMSELRRGAGVFRVIVYLPVALPPVVAALVWKWFYDTDYGLFNQVLGLVGLGPWSWLQSHESAMPSLVLMATWAGAGGTVLIYLAALTGVPSELYEAAEIDGASILRRIWHVTLPQLRGILLLMMLLQLIGTVQVFTEPFVMTDGGPEDSTVTILLLIYRYAFINGDYGTATALSLVLAIVLAILSAIYLRVTKRWTTS